MLTKAALVTVAALTACGGDASSTLGGTATGVLTPVTLHLAYGSESEMLVVEGDGAFAFQSELAEGVPYAVTLVGDPPCVLENDRGAATANPADIVLVCDGVATLAALAVSGPAAPDLGFSPTQLEYAVDVSRLQSQVALIATAAHPDAVITIGGVEVPSGTPSAAQPVGLSPSDISAVVSHPLGWQRTYRVTVSRAAALAQRAYHKASNTDDGDRFGASVALFGDTLAVGAFLEDSAATGVNGDQNSNGKRGSGAVYVFRRTGTSWTQEAYLKASNTGIDDYFGYSLALSGDTLAVGAINEASSATGVNGDQNSDTVVNSGAVYVFQRTGTSWAQQAYIKASNTGSSDSFGYALALAGDVLAVGAPYEDSAATGVNGDQDNEDAPDSGAVYVFERSGSGWSQTSYLKASNSGAGDYVGTCVALFGDTLATGAPYEDSAATGVNGDQDNEDARDSGAVYVFRRNGTTWAQEAYIKAINTGADDYFGISVALAGDTLAAGAGYEDSSAAGVGGSGADDDSPNSGAAYMLARAGTTWTHQAYVKASNPGSNDWFAHGLALSSDTLAVGAFGEDSSARGTGGAEGDDSAANSGAVYIYH